MNSDVVAAVLRRADYRCAWCGLASIPPNCDRGDPLRVMRLDLCTSNTDPRNVVASHMGCAMAYGCAWTPGAAYSPNRAVELLSRAIDGPSTFEVFLDAIRGDLAPGVAFQMALARVEAQRNAPLDLRREVT